MFLYFNADGHLWPSWKGGWKYEKVPCKRFKIENWIQTSAFTKSNHSNKCSRSTIAALSQHWFTARNNSKSKHKKRWNIGTIFRNILERTYHNHILETYSKLEPAHPTLNPFNPGRPRGRPTRKEGVTPLKEKKSGRLIGPEPIVINGVIGPL